MLTLKISQKGSISSTIVSSCIKLHTRLECILKIDSIKELFVNYLKIYYIEELINLRNLTIAQTPPYSIFDAALLLTIMFTLKCNKEEKKDLESGVEEVL